MKKYLFAVALGVLSGTQVINAEDSPAFSWSVTYKPDVWTGLSGGLANKTKYIGNINIELNFDNAKLLNWQGNTALIQFQNLNGQKPNEFVNSLQGIDNIEASNNFTSLYQLWMQQQIGDKFSVLGGLYDLNSEFDVTDSSGVYILPAFGMGTEFSQTGINGAATYPTPSVGARVEYNPTDTEYVKGAIVDAVAGNPNDSKTTHIRLFNHEGALVVLEAGHYFLNSKKETDGKISLGVWRYTKPFEDLVEVDANGLPLKHHNQGAYTLVDYPIYSNPCDDHQTLHAFLRYGVANSNLNPFGKALGIGLTYFSPFTGRTDDIAGIAYSPAYTSAKARLADTSLPRAENQVELTYSAKINEHITIQPDLQFINFAGGDHSIYRNAVNLGVRFAFSISG